MKERPIIFSGEMVRAILDGRKTMTRRVVKFLPRFGDDGEMVGSGSYKDRKGRTQYTQIVTIRHPEAYAACPYGQAGDRLWVREAYSESKRRNHDTGKLEHFKWTYRADEETRPVSVMVCGKRSDRKPIETMADLIVWKSPLFMPREASRITLEITGVRVERLCDISFVDAKAEGIVCPIDGPLCTGANCEARRDEFARMWTVINKKHPWHSNPFVWVIEFAHAEGER